MTPLDPSELSPDERRRELARILATGIVRLRTLGIPGPSAAACLEVSAPTVLSGGCRNGPPGPNETSRRGAANT